MNYAAEVLSICERDALYPVWKYIEASGIKKECFRKDYFSKIYNQNMRQELYEPGYRLVFDAQGKQIMARTPQGKVVKFVGTPNDIMSYDTLTWQKGADGKYFWG